MKLFELADLPITSAEAEEFISKIKKECQPFLQGINGKPLYRGMDKVEMSLKLSVRSDRKPKDMDMLAHTTIDNWFEKYFGIRARSNALFVSGNFNTAEFYGGSQGRVFAIFPIGEIKYVWSKNVRDLYNTVEEKFFYEKQREDDSTIIQQIEEFLDESNYTMEDLASAARSKREIMISCKEYYAIRVKSSTEANTLMKKLAK